MARPALINALTEAERDLMAAVGDLFDTADAVPVSRRRVAILVDAERFDRFLEMLENVAPADAEPDADGERSLGSLEYPAHVEAVGRDEHGRATGTRLVTFSQERWGTIDSQDREADAGDDREDFDPDLGDGDGPAFLMDQTERRIDLSGH